MSRRGFRGRVLRWAVALTLSGSAISVRGCDPAIRDVLLAGLQTSASALADTLIQTFFTALQNDISGSGSGLTTVP